MIMVVFIVPVLSGVMLTSLGYLLNVLWYDLIFYLWHKHQEKKKG
jgi:hypothetical protein